MSPPVRHALVVKLLYGVRYTRFALISHELHGLARIVDYLDVNHLVSLCVRHALVAKLLYGTRYTLFDLISHELHGLARIVDYTDRVNLVSLCVLCALVVKLLYGVRSTRFALISHELHGLARIVNKPFHWKNLRVSTTRRTVHAVRRLPRITRMIVWRHMVYCTQYLRVSTCS